MLAKETSRAYRLRYFEQDGRQADQATILVLVVLVPFLHIGQLPLGRPLSLDHQHLLVVLHLAGGGHFVVELLLNDLIDQFPLECIAATKYDVFLLLWVGCVDECLDPCSAEANNALKLD